MLAPAIWTCAVSMQPGANTCSRRWIDMTSQMKKIETLHAIEEFLYQEASYLDSPDLDSWLELYTEDGVYWMPAIVDQVDPLNHVSLMYDDRVMMEIRKRNFVHPRAASKDYTVRASHIISNVRIKE